MISTIRRITRGVVAASLGVSLVLSVGGCSSTPNDEFDQALAENAELRDRLAETQSMLEKSEDDKLDLIRQNQDLTADLKRAEQQSAPSNLSAATGGFGNGMGDGGDMPSGMRMNTRGDVVLTVAGDVLFPSGQVTLKADGRRELDRIARMIMSQYSGNTVRVEGYTDSDPIRKSSWKSNERLSSERALAVEQYLVGRGVDADRIYSAAMGAAKPKSSKQASRRVEIVILAN